LHIQPLSAKVKILRLRMIEVALYSSSPASLSSPDGGDCTLKVDVLKVPHHGSETASTIPFIQKADPHFVIISASTMHHLPEDTVVRRYKSSERVILRTDRDRASNNDHIVCLKAARGS
jgi:hypothetical protein